MVVWAISSENRKMRVWKGVQKKGEIHTIKVWYRVRGTLCSWVDAVLFDTVVELSVLCLNQRHCASMCESPKGLPNSGADKVPNT